MPEKQAGFERQEAIFELIIVGNINPYFFILYYIAHFYANVQYILLLFSTINF